MTTPREINMSVDDPSNEKPIVDQEHEEARRFIWKRVYTRIFLYLLVILAIVFIFSKPVEPSDLILLVL